jgi:hypothetical protein
LVGIGEAGFRAEPMTGCPFTLRQSIERRLRTPLQAGEVRVFTLLRRPGKLGGLPLYTALFFIPLFLLACFLTVPLSACGFACSSDDALLSGATCPYKVYYEAAPRLPLATDALDPGLGRWFFRRERETVSALNP